ncbi:F0F1 ATP synthase subunit A [Balneolaceae bacterium YR4-1]|uniref:ATP synthase subunit a n=1 Tax=Halalkalibaculum roseum TaxID=2709311 RepID=A0A6M1SUI3_9BACT|nr:F0F1 ATP synthase subunit A [Halalkalibaculum roseum]NGP76570.1 F0F1 ATP synthase subunit A [Halalkalibaculum roseum]
MEFNIDDIIYWQEGFLKVNATLLNTWLVMLLLIVFSWVVTRKLTSGLNIRRGQALLESFVVLVLDQIREETHEEADKYLPFIGTLFLFIVVSNIIGVIPAIESPTASLSTAVALAICVFIAVPVFGISNRGFSGYLKHYIQPTPFMLPFNIIGELSRTLALAIRLFGNIMSGSLIIAILLSLSPLFFPVVMQAFGLLIGVIQAYVFAILALVYIASATRVQNLKQLEKQEG